MCVALRRDYRLEHLQARSAAAFAGAALLNTLTPMDWQIANDVEEAVFHTVEHLRDLVEGGSERQHAFVEVIVHAAHVEFAVDVDHPHWIAERVRLQPRRSFGTPIHCKIEQPRPTPDRPTLWPALAQPRVEESWADTYVALTDVTQSIRAGVTDLAATLQAVAVGVVRATPFTSAAVNLVRRDGDYEVVAVEGPASLRDTLLRTIEPRHRWESAFAGATSWGTTIRYLSEQDAPPEVDDMTTWVPSIPDSDDPDAWQAMDMLFAELVALDGTRLGALAVDVPRDGRRPGVDVLERLELFADHAATSIERARSGRH